MAFGDTVTKPLTPLLMNQAVQIDQAQRQNKEQMMRQNQQQFVNDVALVDKMVSLGLRKQALGFAHEKWSKQTGVDFNKALEADEETQNAIFKGLQELNKSVAKGDSASMDAINNALKIASPLQEDPAGGVSVSPEVTGLAEQIRAEAPQGQEQVQQPTQQPQAQPQATPQDEILQLRQQKQQFQSIVPRDAQQKAQIDGAVSLIDGRITDLTRQIPQARTTDAKTPTPTDIDDSFDLRVNAFTAKNNRPPKEQELVDIRNQAIDDNKRQQSADRAFEKESDKLFVKRIDTRNTEAEEAAFRINRTAVRRQLLNDGMFTGSLANVKTSVNKWLQEAGFEINGQKVANTETFAAISGQDVGEIIKLFGSGTGLSDADREYAQQIVAGNITLTKDSILQILNIRDRIDTALINRYNTGLGKAKSKRPEANILNEEVGIPTTEGSTGNFLKQAPNAEFNKRGKLTKAVDQADIGTVKEYLRATGGNKLQAQKLMRMNGWKF